MANQLTWKDVNFAVGDTVRIHQTFQEGDKTRTQIFEGLVIAIRGHAGLKSFVVRRIATNNVGVEKIFPVETPTITKVEVKNKVAKADKPVKEKKVKKGPKKIVRKERQFVR